MLKWLNLVPFGAKPILFATFFSFGWLGVHLFYLLSAFLLGSIYFNKIDKNNWSIYNFYWHRFLRIFPAYYAQLLILVVLSYFLDYYHVLNFKQLFAHVFMYFNLPPLYVSPLNGVWWTLPIEFLFYLLMPFMVLILEKVGALIFFFLSFIITILYRYFVFQNLDGKNIGYISKFIGQFPGVLIVFSIGLIAAYLVHHNKIKQYSQKWGLLIIILLFIWAQVLLLNLEVYWSGSFLLYIWNSGSALLFMSLILLFYKSNNPLLTNKLFVWFGKVSYGIYLWHLPFILFFKDNSTGFIDLAIKVIPFTLLCAYFSFSLVERRFSGAK